MLNIRRRTAQRSVVQYSNRANTGFCAPTTQHSNMGAVSTASTTAAAADFIRLEAALR
jgi:hypothetical protein